ncbi:MAG: hypothetical protein II071_05095 [Bacteroidales bacterium]|nr:hypothetical protein [Bacteroidales bacterium]
MKKLLLFAAVAALAMTSCEREKSFDGRIADDKEIAFSMQSAATRSSEGTSPVSELQSFSLGQFDGYELFLEEEVLDMNYAAETRGTPVYTENVGYLYSGKLGVYTDAAGGVDATFAPLSSAPVTDPYLGWIYQHDYAQDIWPTNENTEIQFYHRMPTDMTSHGVTSLNNANGSTTVSYTSPTTATQQQDIIFGGTKLSHQAYKSYFGSHGGAPVTLYHALTGVKFAIANDAAELANIKIDKISFIGLKNTGSFVFNTTDHQFSWTASANPTNNIISQEFAVSDTVNYSSSRHKDNHFADSFFAAGTKQNINDAKATKTFWLIPQSFPTGSTAELKINFTQGGKKDSLVVKITDLKAPDWRAAQIRTYTFKIDEINLKIRDELEMHGDADDGYKDSVKKNVKITNTSNTRAFIRAAIVGQWVDVNNDPVFGFTDKVNKLYKVDSWYYDQFGPNAPHNQGLFVGLPGYGDTPNPNNGWQLCKDGYYYYTTAVEPGAVVPDLFTSYKVGIIPNSEIAGAEIDNKDMHFELEIAVQAIKANTLDGTPDTWTNAWKDALGAAPVKKQ